jgi:hypothetical protein
VDNDNTIQSSDPVTIEVMFPSASTIRDNPTVASAMAACWAATKSAASPSGRREIGCYIYFDTRYGNYYRGDTIHGPLVQGDIGTHGSVSLGGALEQVPSNSPLVGGRYCVAFFHTHTPLTYAAAGKRAPVGESTGDLNFANNYSIPGLLYDYIGTLLPNDSGQMEMGIVAGHDLHAPSKIYIFGPNRVPTPMF